MSRCIAVQRDLARIPLGPFQYIQGFAWPSRLPDGFTGPIPGAYTLIAGKLPVPEATVDVVRAAARKAFDQLVPTPNYLTSGLLDYSPQRLEGRVRFLCTDVWPLLYQAAHPARGKRSAGGLAAAQAGGHRAAARGVGAGRHDPRLLCCRAGILCAGSGNRTGGEHRGGANSAWVWRRLPAGDQDVVGRGVCG
ncbi:MAG: hypothetical protein ABI068_16685 [Ktedonobacterales bacterium]